ncbi:GNAT family N-acetyltransferase [Microbacterium terricola]|uniref:N-acetyltransferase n=1 Tax=Microbacterium terricola TaxID=344163 RepID=A0ABM8DZH6_9MICO|nr:GNAT family N-acetyltransferase [Microbacterium terricola]UYK41297.1 GNAT family N-acetyltransferase [Microbacterium terricola]BDV30921.1 N-acetyltransferase [Microbacterium terricola]
MTTIDALAAADRDEWLPLWHAYIRFYESTVADEVTDSTFRRLVAGDGLHGAIARDETGAAIGFVNWLTHTATWTTTTYCYLEDLFVAPEARGSGTGRALISHVERWAREQGCAKVYWLTAETNTTARALYDRVAERTGFIHYEIGL